MARLDGRLHRVSFRLVPVPCERRNSDCVEAASEYEKAYQDARRLISECGLDFDELYPEEDRPAIRLPE